jgi:hypothetical protein
MFAFRKKKEQKKSEGRKKESSLSSVTGDTC